jgi:hypothetical protein
MENAEISSLNPDLVERDWHGTVVVYGSSFGERDHVLFDNHMPRCRVISPTLIEVDIPREMTAGTHTYEVKVKTMFGSYSNSEEFVVL